MAPTCLPADKEYGEAFIDACESGDLSQIHDAIASGRLIPYFRNEGLILSVAKGIQPGYVEVVAALLTSGASITPWVRNAVHGEDMQQDLAVIRLLLDHGLDPNATQSADFERPDCTTQTGGEPLLIYINDPECAREFLSRGADPNAIGPRGKTALLTLSEIWGTPLHLAVFQANADIVKMLLDAGADRTAISVGDRSPGLTPEEFVLDWNKGRDLSDNTWSSSQGLSPPARVNYISVDVQYFPLGVSLSLNIPDYAPSPTHKVPSFFSQAPEILSSGTIMEDADLPTLTSEPEMKDKAGNDVPETQFSTGTAELKGCTTLYITSHKGVFAAHYWENVSFDPDDICLARGDDIWTPEAKAKIFKTTVLDPLKHGSKYHPSLRAKTLEGEYIRAYLIVPDTKWR
ncbi:hypothetical protein WAI453_010288 [Rhynchosporium graminicola]